MTDDMTAERLDLACNGRSLYAIVGRPGLWLTTRRQCDLAGETARARGSSGETMFCRAVEAESLMRKALGQHEKERNNE